jgi:hydrogenase maturation factor
MRQVDNAAKDLNVAVVGGHTEVTPGLRRPIAIGCMVGLVEKSKFVTSSGARPNHDIIMTKSAGIEGTALLATDFGHILKIDIKTLTRARSMWHSISIVRDAMVAVETGGTHAMHDPTEGGLLQGLWEIAEASNVGFMIDQSRIAVREETRRICNLLDVDPLRLMSSGCLLIAADKDKSNLIINRLKKRGVQAEIIGNFTRPKKGRKLIQANGLIVEIVPSERDELYRVIESYGLE